MAVSIAVVATVAIALATAGISRAEGPTTAPPNGFTICDANGDSQLDECPPEGYVVRQELATAGKNRMLTRVPQVHVGQISDMHIVDYGPLQVEPLDHLGAPLTASYHPNDVTQLSESAAMVDRLNGITSPITGAPVANWIVTGDSADNRQQNQTQNYVGALDGGPVKPASGLRDASILDPVCFWADLKWADEAFTGSNGNSWFYDPDASSEPGDPQPWIDGPGYSPFPDENSQMSGQGIRPGQWVVRDFTGLYEAALQATQVGGQWQFGTIDSPGLGAPWYAVDGNHDMQVWGNIGGEVLGIQLDNLLSSYSTGCLKLLPKKLDGSSGGPQTVPGEPDLSQVGLNDDLANEVYSAITAMQPSEYADPGTVSKSEIVERSQNLASALTALQEASTKASGVASPWLAATPDLLKATPSASTSSKSSGSSSSSGGSTTTTGTTSTTTGTTTSGSTGTTTSGGSGTGTTTSGSTGTTTSGSTGTTTSGASGSQGNAPSAGNGSGGSSQGQPSSGSTSSSDEGEPNYVFKPQTPITGPPDCYTLIFGDDDHCGFTFTAVPGDPSRQILNRAEWVNEHFDSKPNGPSGHGFQQQCDPKNPQDCKLYYSVNPVDSKGNPIQGIRYIGLDTVNHEIYDDGHLDDTQFQWLKGELDAAQQANELVFIYAHMSLRTIDNAFGDLNVPMVGGNGPWHYGLNIGDPVNDLPGGADFQLQMWLGLLLDNPAQSLRDLLLQYPNIGAYISGHEHFSRIWPHTGDSGYGFWEINTPSHLDWPKQARLIEAFDNCDGTLSLYTTMVNSAGAPNAYPGYDTKTPQVSSDYETVASVGRELTHNDPQAYTAGGPDALESVGAKEPAANQAFPVGSAELAQYERRPGDMLGGAQWGLNGPGLPKDRNTELLLKKPAGVNLGNSCQEPQVPSVNLTVPDRVEKNGKLVAHVSAQTNLPITRNVWSLDGGSTTSFDTTQSQQPHKVTEEGTFTVDTAGLEVGTHRVEVSVTSGTADQPLTKTVAANFQIVPPPPPPGPPAAPPAPKRHIQAGPTKPISYITDPKPKKNGRAKVKKLTRIKGYADDVLQPISKVRVAIVKKSDGKCFSLGASKFSANGCSEPQFLDAKLGKPDSVGMVNWQYDLSKKQRKQVKRGDFTLVSVSVDKVGYTEQIAKKGLVTDAAGKTEHNIVRVKVGR